MKTRFTLLAAMAAVSAMSFGQRFFMSTDLMSYDMTMTKYATLSDAQNATNALGSYTLTDGATNDRRDMGTYFVRDVATFDTDQAIFLTAWWYTTDPNNGQYSGWGNPNNTNTGFIQMYDGDASTVTTWDAQWSVLNAGVADGSTFTLSAQGAGADYTSDFARLWHGATGGAGSLTRGIFHNWNFQYSASGLTADWDNTHGLYAAYDHPDAVTGSISGIFENTNTTDTQYNGFYVFNGTLNVGSWAYAQGGNLNGAFSDSAFGAVPEPGSMALLGLAALAGLRKRSKK